MGLKHCPAAILMPSLTSLLRQPFTITCWDRFDRNCANICRQHRTYNTHTTKLIENSLMVDAIKGGVVINLHDTNLLPTLSSTLKCMGHEQKCIAGTQTFPISKLGGWKYTIGSINCPRQTNTRQYWCHGNWPPIGNRGGLWTFQNLGDIVLSPANRETTVTNKPLKHDIKINRLPRHQQSRPFS